MSHKLPLSDIQFLSDFHAFCLTRGDEGYDFFDNCGCALAQFLHATGRCKKPDVAGFGQWREAGRHWQQAPLDHSDWPKERRVLAPEPRTFSALATRLEALLAYAPAVVQS